MKRTALAFILAALAPLAFGQADETGAQPVRTPDRSTTCTLDALNETCSIKLEGRRGAGAYYSTTALTGTVIGEVSFDGGTTWIDATIMWGGVWDAWGDFSSKAFSSSTVTEYSSFVLPGGATDARFRMSAFTSGSVMFKLAATMVSGIVRVIDRNEYFVINPFNLDLDSGAGTTSRQSMGLAGASTSGPIPLEGTAANGLEVDVTRVQGGSAADGAAVSGNPLRIAGKDGSGNTQDVITGTDGRLEVKIHDGVDTALILSTGELITATIGRGADGAAVTGNPVLIAGQDGTNAQSIKTDSTGSIQVDIESAPSLTIGTFPDNEPFNLALWNGTAPTTATTLSDTFTNPTAPPIGSFGMLWDTSQWVRWRQPPGTTQNTNGTGLAGVTPVAFFDDSAPTTITENNGGALRISTNRNLYSTIRDAAGNERGANVNASNAMLTAQTGELPAGTQNIGDVDIASLPNEGQQTAANSISVTPDTDNDAIGATAAAVPGEAVYVAGTDGTNVTPFYVDPCEREARTVYRVDIVTATTTEIAAATASEFYYVCSINLVTAAANNVIIVEDDTATNCPSPTAGVSSGGTTAAEGWNFAANGGIVVGNGQKWIMKTGTANRSFCIITSAGTQLSGTITYVSAP